MDSIPWERHFTDTNVYKVHRQTVKSDLCTCVSNNIPVGSVTFLDVCCLTSAAHVDYRCQEDHRKSTQHKSWYIKSTLVTRLLVGNPASHPDLETLDKSFELSEQIFLELSIEAGSQTPWFWHLLVVPTEANLFHFFMP